MKCGNCHKDIPRNVGYYLHLFAGKLITTCQACHENRWGEERGND